MQNKLTLKDLTLFLPDGFHVMDEAEWSKMQLLASGECTGLADPQRHIIVTAGYKQTNSFSAALLSGRDLVKNTEKQIRKSMTSLGYSLICFGSRTVADGLHYSGIEDSVS